MAINGAASKFNNPFEPLKHKNFLYYFIGMIISQTGSWMQAIAQPWLAYRLTDSPFLLSLVSALQFLPVLLFSLFAGVIIDKYSNKKLLIITQISFLVITMALAILAWMGKVQYWHLLITSALMGITNTLDMPVRQSFVIELVGKDNIMNAIALNSAVFNTARIFGPALAGIVMYSFGPALCFFFNSVSFAAVLVSLIFIKPYPVEKRERANQRISSDIKEGLKYIYGHKILLSTVVIMTVFCVLGFNYNVLVPVFADKILNKQEVGYGLLMSFTGIGALAGALLTAAVSKSGPKRFLLYTVPVIVSFLLILLGFVRSYYLAGIILAAMGFFAIMAGATANSSMQLNVSNEYRGRVMSLYNMSFTGLAPLGNLFAGAVANKYNSAIGFIVCGVVLLVLIIPIYIFIVKKGGKPV